MAVSRALAAPKSGKADLYRTDASWHGLRLMPT
jgi:hypothetical protein